ncbi:DNA polymerase III subunit beta [Candidatus Wolfebacteria bacterium RBG_13_41_7]|uniref:Beta sliding clamp n=1 Tax=Candidatus Wolfebacteria bacterium RBG_13_41_7 TaxID=1802554 RepID=A0A1F8DNS0_9BACT|nr:MAG: DNA polymerase III subunit beta [Candidatus Wolfebacteria bacterium RBG_13_41_7]
MKIIILKNHLKFGLDIIGKTSADNNFAALPVLKNFLIETIDNKVKLLATNLETAITAFVPGKVIEDGILTIPFSIFNSVINNIQSERINIETEGNQLFIKTDNYKAKIHIGKKDDFPIIPQIKNQLFIEIPSSLIKNAFMCVIGAGQISEIKPELSGILFDFQNNYFKIAATDSFRLAEKTIINTQFKTEIEDNFRVIIPLKTIHEIIRNFKDENSGIKIYFDPSQVLFKSENCEIISRLISGEFPDYQTIIPQAFETEVVIEKEQLISALKLTSSFTDRLNEIKIIIKDGAKNIEVFSSNQTIGESSYLIPAKIKGVGVEVIFNWRFLIDGVKSANSENIFLGFNGGSRPVLIRSQGDISCFYILMPINPS